MTALSAVAFTASVPIWGHVADVLLGRPRALQVSAIGGGLALAVTLLPVPPIVVAICFIVVLGLPNRPSRRSPTRWRSTASRMPDGTTRGCA